ncbi:MAG TPA: phosphotransferase [Thermoanaerobaculia bacterium]|nr:phosphotransferase [Thermoanaerobaculia bacterium]
MTVSVADPFGATADTALPFLARATNPADVERRIGPLLGGSAKLLSIRVVRHKPGRRCLVEYDFEAKRANGGSEHVTLVGKARARGAPSEGDRLLRLLRGRGFGDAAEDGVSLPEPLGVVGEYHMSLQRKVPGVPASRLFGKPGDAALARRIARAASKLHRAGLLPHRSHSIAEEIAILREKLGELSASRPEWGLRLARLMEECERLAAGVPTTRLRGIHRDLYADQVLVDGPRLYLVDFDLFCQGDPALDAGNFLGHMSEQALRCLGDPAALSDSEEAFEEEFVSLSGSSIRPAVRAYATLTVARHVYLSTRYEERRPFTESLLELAEARLRASSRIGRRRGAL